MSQYQKPKPSNLTKDEVSQLAESIADELGYKPGGELLPIVERLGGRVRYKDFWSLEGGDSGSTEVRGEGDFDVFLATDTSYTRDRFTTAHELGHYILHYLLPKSRDPRYPPMRASRYGSDRSEWEANWFAAAWLMPETAFRQAYAALGGDLVGIADRFGVSVAAAEVRAKALGIIE